MKSCFVYTGILSPDQLLLMIQAIERTNFYRVAAENVPGIVSQNTFRGTFWQGEVAGMHTLILTNPVGKYVIAIEGPAGAKGGDILWQTYVKRQVEAALGMLSSQRSNCDPKITVEELSRASEAMRWWIIQQVVDSSSSAATVPLLMPIHQSEGAD